ncbi:MAG TPA: fumarylacetoacetate hydrolase family protein [Aggregatilinea sp.]|jgi:2-dehydro-3-deoxy-D-arabinonate dehydratase|uniref:fumarylacetoacetate hydrolase family protein n=1 Tax=Aggregatilinea sp. TaxID=2806333 RepID=UPI002D130856|nr:fumarylacetoacetate hydrolase family protein [Aggregatilinea sp.]HML20929.1 fumarylacetoacetate hydrolase family protein [Aggregatilinea sp.]
MWLVRVFVPGSGIKIGVHHADTVYDISQQVPTISAWLQSSVGNPQSALDALATFAESAANTYPAAIFDHAPSPDAPHWLAPVDVQDVWAAGVTYARSREARQEEADDGGDVYLRVYGAERPELFFKARGEWVVGQYGEVGIRSDASWNVPEPELALVMNPALEIVGITAGNDMSSRDIEGENPLYLPQAKIYTAACALGHGIRLQSVTDFPDVSIRLEIQRGGDVFFSGETATRNIQRRARDLLAYLGHSLTFPHGVVLLTGTGIVPPNDFTLHAGDTVRVAIDGVDTLINTVKIV